MRSISGDEKRCGIMWRNTEGIDLFYGMLNLSYVSQADVKIRISADQAA